MALAGRAAFKNISDYSQKFMLGNEAKQYQICDPSPSLDTSQGPTTSLKTGMFFMQYLDGPLERRKSILDKKHSKTR